MAKSRIEIDNASLEELEKQLGDVGKYISSRAKIIRVCCIRMQPLVRSWLLANLKSSGIKLNTKENTGELIKWVGEAIVYPSKNGLRIGPPKDQPARVYAKMASIQNGFIYGLHVSDKNTRKKIRRNIKKTGSAPTGIGLTAAHPYFNLNSGQLAQFGNIFNQYFGEEFNRMLKGRE